MRACKWAGGVQLFKVRGVSQVEPSYEVHEFQGWTFGPSICRQAFHGFNDVQAKMQNSGGFALGLGGRSGICSQNVHRQRFICFLVRGGLFWKQVEAMPFMNFGLRG